MKVVFYYRYEEAAIPSRGPLGEVYFARDWQEKLLILLTEIELRGLYPP